MRDLPDATIPTHPPLRDPRGDRRRAHPREDWTLIDPRASGIEQIGEQLRQMTEAVAHMAEAISAVEESDLGRRSTTGSSELSKR